MLPERLESMLERMRDEIAEPFVPEPGTLALDNDEPSRNHVHTVIRTTNGNDHGTDLLR